MSITLAEQMAEIRREIALRERVYPRWIQGGRMKQAQADKYTDALRAALETLADIEMRVLGEREACAELASEHSCETWPECCNCGGAITAAIRERGRP